MQLLLVLLGTNNGCNNVN